LQRNLLLYNEATAITALRNLFLFIAIAPSGPAPSNALPSNVAMIMGSIIYLNYLKSLKCYSHIFVAYFCVIFALEFIKNEQVHDLGYLAYYMLWYLPLLDLGSQVMPP
jgi:hypothetical protein